MMTITAKWTNARQAMAYKLRIQRLKNLTPFWKAMAIFELNKLSKTFKSQGARDGLPAWKPLALSTQMSKGHRKNPVRSKNKIGPKTAGESGRRGNLNILNPQGASGWRGKFRVLSLTGQQLKFGNEMKWGKWSALQIHQFGVPKNKLPARPILGFAQSDADKIHKLFLSFYSKGQI